MNNNIAIMLIGLLLLNFSWCAAATDPSGEAIFIKTCSRCHRTADSLRTEPHKIAELLNSQTIRQHRFTLDASEVQALIKYLQQGRT